MLETDAGRLLAAFGFINTTGQMLITIGDIGKVPEMGVRDVAELRDHICTMIAVGEELDLPMTVAVGQELLGELDRLPEPTPEGRVTPDRALFVRICGSVERLQNAKYEARAKLFLGLGAKGVALWSPVAPPFGNEADAAFPSSRDDIYEAAKCLAVERGTACVMHLMRATEGPLKALATHLNVGRQNDWGSYIREITKELNARMKAAGKHTADEIFYAEACEAFERVKRAWRNKSMHLDHTYTESRAREIYEATRDFMAFLAPRIHE